MNAFLFTIDSLKKLKNYLCFLLTVFRTQLLKVYVQFIIKEMKGMKIYLHYALQFLDLHLPSTQPLNA